MKQADQIVNEVKKAVVGKDIIIKKILMVILAKGHILLEDIPGVGKTTMALAYAKALSLKSKRIQFTPDVMPSDVVGFTMMDKQSGELRYMPGAAFCNVFLADEINRTSSKTQSALLEVMEEGRITVDGYSREVPKPFLVIATQNPIGSAGTQLLPESQLDRFMVRLSIGYPSIEDEVEMMKRKSGHEPLEDIVSVASAEVLEDMIKGVEQVYVSDEIYHYLVALIDRTRNHPNIQQGASPRAALALCAMAKSCAYLSDRDYVVPQDIKAVFFDTIAHRILIQGDQRNLDKVQSIMSEILRDVAAPRLVR